MEASSGGSKDDEEIERLCQDVKAGMSICERAFTRSENEGQEVRMKKVKSNWADYNLTTKQCHNILQVQSTCTSLYSSYHRYPPMANRSSQRRKSFDLVPGPRGRWSKLVWIEIMKTNSNVCPFNTFFPQKACSKYKKRKPKQLSLIEKKILEQLFQVKDKSRLA